MDTNVQALKNLYVALGGEASDVADLTTSSEVITAMESVAASAASELPVVKKADAGKNLTVNSSGKWAAIMPEDELPAVTASDDGKLLGVSSGAWGAVENNVIVIPATLTFNSETSKWTIAPAQEANMKNCDEIFNAIVANKVVRIYAKDGNNGHIFDILDYNASTKNVNFREMFTNGTSLTFRYFTFSGYSSIAFSGILIVKSITFDT